MFKVQCLAFQFLLLVFCARLNAQYIQAHPAVADIDMAIESFPYPVYMNGYNHFKFVSKQEITACNISITANQGTEVKDSFVVRKTEDRYVISANGMYAYNQVSVPVAHINFFFKDGTVKRMLLRLKLYTPLKVEFLDSLGKLTDISAGVIKYNGAMQLHSKADPPFYVQVNRMRDVFTVTITTAGGILLQELRGYFDAGHTIRRLDLSSFKKYKTVLATITGRIDTENGWVDAEISKYNSSGLKITLEE